MEIQASNKSQVRAVFANVNYVRLLLAQTIGAFGDRIHQMALLSFMMAVSYSTNTTKHIADITTWGILPTAVFGPFAMTLVDRWPWKRIMLMSTLFRCTLALAMPAILLTWYNIHTAWITAFLLGTFAAVFAPCRLAIMPNLVPKNQLLTTNAISSQVGNFATLVGVPVGGYLVDVIGRNTCFYLDGAAFFIAAFLVVLLKLGFTKSKPPPEHSSQRPSEDLKEGLRYLRNHHDIRLTLLFFSFLTLVSSFLYVCLLSYSIEVLGLKERGMGQLLGILGLGMAIGAALLVWKPRLGEHPRLPYLGLAGAGVLIWRMSQGGSSHFIAALLLGIGFCGIMSLVPNDTYLQHHVPDKVRGRVFVVRGVFQGAIWLFSMQLVKSAVHHMGLVWVLAWLGIGSMIMAALFGFLPAPSSSPRKSILTPS